MKKETCFIWNTRSILERQHTRSPIPSWCVTEAWKWKHSRRSLSTNLANMCKARKHNFFWSQSATALRLVPVADFIRLLSFGPMETIEPGRNTAWICAGNQTKRRSLWQFESMRFKNGIQRQCTTKNDSQDPLSCGLKAMVDNRLSINACHCFLYAAKGM